MGEYYTWVNVDKKEYIGPGNFDYGLKLYESSCRGNPVLCALREMLSKEWAGDHVFFMADEKLIPEDSRNETLRKMYERTVQNGSPGDGDAAQLESFKNISGLFKAAKEDVTKEIEFYVEKIRSGDESWLNEYGIDINDPFKGLFLREGRDFRFTMNHTKKVYYSFEETRMIDLQDPENFDTDPLPILMAYGGLGQGAWLGDLIGVSDDRPEGYELLREIYLDF